MAPYIQFGPCLISGCTCDETVPFELSETLHKPICREHLEAWARSTTYLELKRRDVENKDLTEEEAAAGFLQWVTAYPYAMDTH